METDYIAPPEAPHAHLVAALESEAGRLVLRPNRLGHGYKLHADAEGFGAGDVENEVVPRLGRRGAMLGEQRETEGDMFLPIIIKSTSAAEVRRMVSELTAVLQLANGTLRVGLTDSASGESRWRDIAYKSGLGSPVWASPLAVRFGITADYMDPWAYSAPRSETLNAIASEFQGGWIAPFVFPLVATGTSVPSAVTVNNEGTLPAPVKITFYGPSTNPRAWAGPIEVQYNGALAWDEWVTVDGKTLSVKLGGGGRTEPIDVPGRLSPHTLLSELTVPVGRTDWWYEAIDPTALSRAEFTWWDAYQSMQ